MYTITNQYGETIGTARSVKSAKMMVEEYFQCGITKSESKVAKQLNLLGFCYAPCKVDESILCTITKR